MILSSRGALFLLIIENCEAKTKPFVHKGRYISFSISAID